MDALVYYCPGCGQPVDIDYKTRKGTCSWCGNIVSIPRKIFNSDGKVRNDIPCLIKNFKEKRYREALSNAENIFSVAIDYAPALFVRAYYESYVSDIKNSNKMADFFAQLSELDLDAEEVEFLKEMFMLSIFKLDAYEHDILTWALANLPDDDLLKFVDDFSPRIIGKRINIDFFVDGNGESYKEIAKKCSVPKTCYALLTAIRSNPDSPFLGNKFFLKTKTQRFYNDFVLPVGEIISSMSSFELKGKFYQVYKQLRSTYENKMKGGTV